MTSAEKTTKDLRFELFIFGLAEEQLDAIVVVQRLVTTQPSQRTEPIGSRYCLANFMSKPVWFQTREWLRLLEVPNKTGVEMLNTETIPNLLEIQVWLKITKSKSMVSYGFRS